MTSRLLLPTEVDCILRMPGAPNMSPTSLGGWGYVVLQGPSATLIDVPHYSEMLAEEVRKLAPGGVGHILLTHDDWVQLGDHELWKRAFPGAVRVVHSTDSTHGPLEVELSGSGPWDVAGFRVDLVPGHSKGSVFYSSSELSAVFTGDSIALWGDQPTGFGFRCHFNAAMQAESLRGYAQITPFCKALLPSHGLPKYFKDEQERISFFNAAAAGLDGGNGSS
eukprot:CAMPEP_0171100406 /NCGR_PEP_ID=MMETSP0766_2-20121228/52940_1 /TAXON_ID=439317 /ORGANISM="Gambierdiscus australes, Strain CAWD 149" /LENGTH=221 /DNA_ID=CAMNT_0011560229 /DNA_START=22 /DNA_END=687 /DNA_ORIENTATION=+